MACASGISAPVIYQKNIIMGVTNKMQVRSAAQQPVAVWRRLWKRKALSTVSEGRDGASRTGASYFIQLTAQLDPGSARKNTPFRGPGSSEMLHFGEVRCVLRQFVGIAISDVPGPFRPPDAIPRGLSFAQRRAIVGHCVQAIPRSLAVGAKRP